MNTRRLLAALTLILALALPGARALAADKHADPQPAVKVEELERLVSTLESDHDRARLVEQLKGLIAAQRNEPKPEDDSLLALLSERLSAFGDEVMDGVAALKDLPELAARASAQLADPMRRGQLGDVLGRLGLILAAGVILDRLLASALGRSRREAAPDQPLPALVKLPLALARTIIDLVPVAGFAAAGYGVATLLALAGNGRMAALMLITAYAGVRVVMVAARTLAAPRTPGLRLLPLDDETAEYVVIWVRRLATVGVFGAMAAQAGLLLGLPKGAYAVAVKALGLGLATMLVIFVMQNRQTVAGWIRNGGERLFNGRVQMLRNRLADIWHVLAAIYVVAGYSVWAIQVKGGFEFMVRATVLTVVILVTSGAVSGLLRGLIDRGFAISQEVRDRFPRLEARANRYLPVLHVVLRGAVLVLTVLALAQAWGLGTLGWLVSDTGRHILSSAISIATVLVAAAVVWELVSGGIERYLSATDSDGQALQRSARARTLLPLARNALFLFLLVMVGLIVLAELGVNIAPLLAGAGVVGIAIGFGSQKLVQDVITGAFILFEDTIAVGDVVKLGEHSGSVEAISVRAIRLRDAQGGLHTVPFSAVGTVINLNRDYAYAVLDATVAWKADTDKVAALLAEIGAEMEADPELAPSLLAPLEVLGVEKLDATGSVVVRARFKTKALDQWKIGREFNKRLKTRVDVHGIPLPGSSTTVFLGDTVRVEGLGA